MGRQMDKRKKSSLGLEEKGIRLSILKFVRADGRVVGHFWATAAKSIVKTRLKNCPRVPVMGRHWGH